MDRSHIYNNIPIELFRSLVLISDHGSFTRAAEELSLTQPAVSAQMKRLQQLVGGELFVKKPAGVSLSELGSTVEGYARRILALNDQVVGIAGETPNDATLRIGIQNVFVQKVSANIVNGFPVTNYTQCKVICGTSMYLAENLNSGYLDLAFMIAPMESRRNLIAEWKEKIVWLRAPHFCLAVDQPIPLVNREGGMFHERVIEVLDDSQVPYRIVCSASDFWTIAAAVKVGIGVMVGPERAVYGLSDSLIIADDRILPKLPELRSGVFFKEGFDLERNKSLVNAFVSAVEPSHQRANR